MNADEIRPGIYLHFKGGRYFVEGVVRDAETECEYVLYRPLYGDDPQWFVRLREHFSGTVSIGDRVVRRFEYVDHDDPAGDDLCLRRSVAS